MIRTVRYSLINRRPSSSWPSRNMFILGGFVLVFLVIHLANFFWKVRFGHVGTVTINGTEMENVYSLVSSLFTNWWYVVIYILGAVFLALHLSHGFWASFQSLGLANDLWRRRLKRIAYGFAILMGVGFSTIPIYLFISGN